MLSAAFGLRYLSDPQLSSARDEILFTEYQNPRESGHTPDLRVFRVRSDGSRMRPVVPDRSIATRMGRWTPDGTHLTWLQAEEGRKGHRRRQIRWNLWAQPADGGDPRKITTMRSGVRDYKLGPKNEVAFVSLDALSLEEARAHDPRTGPYRNGATTRAKDGSTSFL